MNVIRFPVCRNINGLHWYGGCGYQTTDAVKAVMSDRDWRRVMEAAWEQHRRSPVKMGEQL